MKVPLSSSTQMPSAGPPMQKPASLEHRFPMMLFAQAQHPLIDCADATATVSSTKTTAIPNALRMMAPVPQSFRQVKDGICNRTWT